MEEIIKLTGLGKLAPQELCERVVASEPEPYAFILICNNRLAHYGAKRFGMIFGPEPTIAELIERT